MPDAPFVAALAAAAVKALLLLGALLLAGAGLFARWLGREFHAPPVRRRVGAVALLGAALVMAFSLLDVAASLWTLLGFLNPPLVGDYLRATLHGRAALLRIALALPLAALALPRPDARPAGRWIAGVLFGLGALALLTSLSLIGHNAAMGGRLPLAADLVHVAAAFGWATAVGFTAFLPLWSPPQRPALARVVTRVSRVGLGSVALLSVSGSYSAWLHLGSPAALWTSRYGLALLAKLTLVAAILALAAWNRWRLLPALQRTAAAEPEGDSNGDSRGDADPPLARALQLEALLLAAVLAVTGLLASSPPPH